ncbi:MAG: response regulator [candidate division WOR-3 bacterium]|nr:MAG: response regulator [candidate division WOR-3 bacterium]
MDKPRILVIDDEKAICDACAQILGAEKYEVATEQDGESGLDRLDEFAPGVVLVDLKMQGLSGIDILERVKEKDHRIVPIVITGYATVESAVECMKVGAYDYLPKPFTTEQLRMIVKRALNWRAALLEAERISDEKEKLRQNYISMISHEMMTPLVAVVQYLEVLRNGFAGKLSAEQERVTVRMKTRLDELLRLIERWLKLARIEDVALRKNFTDVSLPEVIASVLEEASDMIEVKKIRVNVDLPSGVGVIKGDAGLVKEIFMNLVSNGVKYNREHGELSVRLREGDEYWVVEISDTGIGISEEDIPRVGEEFYRIKSEGTIAGSGIGLAIVKRIIEVHNGKLEIESKLEQGSTFSVLLPRIMKQAKE